MAKTNTKKELYEEPKYYSKFKANRFDYIFHAVVWYTIDILSFFTLYPLVYVHKLRYLALHTEMDGKKLVFVGKVKDAYKKMILYLFLTIITLGIFYFFVKGKLLRWQIENTHFLNGSAREIQSCFNYKLSDYSIICINGFIYMILTLGLGYPHFVFVKQKTKEDNRKLDGKKTMFTGDVHGLYEVYILNLLLTYITGGLYKPFKDYEMEKYIRKNTALYDKDRKVKQEPKLLERVTNACLRHKGRTLFVYILILLGLIALVCWLLYFIIMTFVL